jgi:hypothetical protein
MGNCLSGGKKKKAADPSAKKVASKVAAPADGAGKDAVSFGFDQDFSKLYKLDEELGRGQYGVTYRNVARLHCLGLCCEVAPTT